jgi:hypothetical protein
MGQFDKVMLEPIFQNNCRIFRNLPLKQDIKNLKVQVLSSKKVILWQNKFRMGIQKIRNKEHATERKFRPNKINRDVKICK